MILLFTGFLSWAIAAVKLLLIQLVLSGWARCPPHNHVEKILVQIKGATAY
ncbi:MAG: hypothetical protein HWQ38_30750 [Nostoc sp. NMS7]|uniref:hypothetical protein n=1 Tax=unclassified Nostoc TaxID=2593658 RepID=UPI0025E10CF9|nr:hypothetical protein [Nostoc sp. NMS7]MBN3950610.1 hypothetical protein [Nostoc sp. NMS7]